MRKQLPIVVVSVLLTQTVSANNTFNMDDINSTLQLEYQTQLVLQPKVRHKAARKRQATVRKQTVRRQQQRSPQLQAHRAASTIPSYSPPARKLVASNAESLFEAATYGNVGLIAQLLKKGININVANSEQETALHMAAANGRYPAVIYLINHGANIHARTIKNWLPIHHATRFRKANIANYLMKKGSSPHARTSDGLSAIDMAKATRDQRLLGLYGVR